MKINGKLNDDKRITADFSPEGYEVLAKVARSLDTSKASTLRKGLRLLDVLLHHQSEGWKLVLEKAGERKEILPL